MGSTDIGHSLHPRAFRFRGIGFAGSWFLVLMGCMISFVLRRIITSHEDQSDP
jgi:hypothetical protein